MVNDKKASVICILKVLEKYTDASHYLTQQDIIDKLKEDYDIEVERKSVSASLKLLINIGYDINRYKNSGYYLLSRDYDTNEIHFLVDAIYSSKIINHSQSKQLIQKLLSHLSIYEEKQFEYLYKTSQVSRTNTNELFLNIEVISEAIRRNKQISFHYLGYKEDKSLYIKNPDRKYRISPYYLINNYGKYYLLSNYDRYNDITVYRSGAYDIC